MASSKIQTINELNFESLVLGAEGPVLLDFTASWCGPCKAQTAILERVAEGSSAVLVGCVDVDECPELAARFGVRGMPTLLAFSAGKETGRRLGLTSEQGVRALLDGSARAA
jgi:thioredoxin 1